MKAFKCFILSFCLVLALIACKKSNKADNPPSNQGGNGSSAYYPDYNFTPLKQHLTIITNTYTGSNPAVDKLYQVYYYNTSGTQVNKIISYDTSFAWNGTSYDYRTDTMLFSYSNGRLAAIQSGSVVTQRFIYDVLQRNSGIINQLNDTTFYSYNGNLVIQTQANTKTYYYFDGQNNNYRMSTNSTFPPDTPSTYITCGNLQHVNPIENMLGGKANRISVNNILTTTNKGITTNYTYQTDNQGRTVKVTYDVFTEYYYY